MFTMDKRKIRDYCRLCSSLLFCWLYFPHFLIYELGGAKKTICCDLKRYRNQVTLNLPVIVFLLFLLHNNRYFRTIFYHRIGPIAAMLLGWYRPGDRYFLISTTTKIGEGFLCAHPYSTIINAESIGKNFSCLHCTTFGYGSNNSRPIVGDNVSFGASVTVIGGVHIGNNVIIGAGSVVVKDIPDNCVAAGNPCKVIRYNANEP